MKTLPDERLPWFRVYAARRLADGQVWSEPARAAWLMLEARLWRDGSLPADLALLARHALMDEERFRGSAWPDLSAHLEPHPTEHGRLVCPALEEQRADALKVSRTRAEAGRKSGEARRNPPRRRRNRASNICSTHAQQMLNDTEVEVEPETETRDVQDTSMRSPETANARRLREHVERVLGYSVKPAGPEAASVLEDEIALHGEQQVAELCVEAGRRSPRPVLSMSYFATPGVLEGADRGPPREPGPLNNVMARLRRRSRGLPVPEVERPQRRSNEGETNSTGTNPTTGTDKA